MANNLSHLHLWRIQFFFLKLMMMKGEISKDYSGFEDVSGLKIIFQESLVRNVGLDEDMVKEFSSILRCKAHFLPLCYLEMPLGVRNQNGDEACISIDLC